jgi:hypothetical protein
MVTVRARAGGDGAGPGSAGRTSQIVPFGPSATSCVLPGLVNGVPPAYFAKSSSTTTAVGDPAVIAPVYIPAPVEWLAMLRYTYWHGIRADSKMHVV